MSSSSRLLLSSAALRSRVVLRQHEKRRFLASSSARRHSVSLEERAALRKARKERGMQYIQQVEGGGGAGAADATAGSPSATSFLPNVNSRWVWYLGLGIPTVALVWGLNDKDSPPAKFSDAIGLTDFIQRWSDDFVKPSHEKLLPDWSQMPNVPHDIPVPHTLVLDLEETLVSSTWDRRYGWRHAKRPGVDKFLQDMAQYYEIVLYTPSLDAIAIPVVDSLDPHGTIMHRLFRDATHYHDGVHVKDLDKLNRNVNRIVVLDDDPEAVQFHPDNLIRVKPYTDPTDRTDNTLERITPLLIEIAREGYNDVPAILRQFRDMDAVEIADEQDRRIQAIQDARAQQASRGLGGLVKSAKNNLPEPELSPMPDYNSGSKILSSQDLVGAAPPPNVPEGGVMDWLNKRNKEKEEQHARKMEKWNQVMMKRQQERMAKDKEKESKATA